jgi:hypothetical protein
MPHVKRRLFTVAGFVALALCAASAAMCLITARRCAYVERDLGYYRGPNAQVLQGLDQAYWQGTVIYVHRRHIPWSSFGEAGLAQFNADHPPRARWHFGWLDGGHRAVARLPRRTRWNAIGFHYAAHTVRFAFSTEHHRVLAVPAWLPIVVLMPAGVLLLRAHWWRPRRRRRLGLCDTCGYDLRGTPDRCPECGAATRAAASGQNNGSARIRTENQGIMSPLL